MHSSLIQLQNLLHKLLPMKNEFNQEKFDPRTAIFVCNRWDMVAEGEKEHVKKDTIRKLKACWPKFNPDKQLFFMDTEFAWHTAQDGYITDDYAKLIDGMQELLPMGLQRKLRLAYWLVVSSLCSSIEEIA